MKNKAPRKKPAVNRVYYIYVGILAVLFFTFHTIPFLKGVMYSFTDWNGLAKDFKFIGLANYIEAFTNKRFQNAVLFNIKFTILAVILVVGISLILGLIFNSDIRLKSFFRGIFFFPAVLGMLVVGLIFNEIFYRVVPVIGKAMNISWLSTNILASKSTAMYGVLIVHVWLAVAMATVMLLAGLQSTPMELYDRRVPDCSEISGRGGRAGWSEQMAEISLYHDAVPASGFIGCFDFTDQKRTDSLRYHRGTDQWWSWWSYREFVDSDL